MSDFYSMLEYESDEFTAWLIRTIKDDAEWEFVWVLGSTMIQAAAEYQAFVDQEGGSRT